MGFPNGDSTGKATKLYFIFHYLLFNKEWGLFALFDPLLINLIQKCSCVQISIREIS
jgi:hypothetical protein